MRKSGEIVLGYLTTVNDYNDAAIGITIKQEKFNLENIISIYNNKIEKEDIENIIVYGRQSFVYQDEIEGGCSASVVLIPDNNKTFQISFQDCNVPIKNYSLARLYTKKIISTFKFIKQ